MPIYPFEGKEPRLGARVFLAPTAALVGDIEVGDDSSFWFHSAVRADVNWIRIGHRTNIQDGSILHVTHETYPLIIGDGVVIGHGAILHGCRVEDGALIGIGARVLDGAVVRRGAQVAAGSLVTPGKEIAAGHLAMGSPARVVRPLSEQERENIAAIAERYVTLKEKYRSLS